MTEIKDTVILINVQTLKIIFSMKSRNLSNIELEVIFVQCVK